MGDAAKGEKFYTLVRLDLPQGDSTLYALLLLVQSDLPLYYHDP
jgi:hypothetical protein